MSETIICPDCKNPHSINDMELWEVYEEDGKETEIDCNNCDKPLIITSMVMRWEFETVLRDE